MKTYDENDNLIENPDLEKGYLKNGKKTIHHDAVEAVEEKFHYEILAEYPNGGKSVRKVVDVPGVAAKDAYDEEVEVQRYVLYTAEELAAQEEARKKQEAKEKLPETVAELQKENEMLKQCLLEMSEIVYA